MSNRGNELECLEDELIKAIRIHVAVSAAGNLGSIEQERAADIAATLANVLVAIHQI